MEVRYGVNPVDAKMYTTEELRKEFLIQNLFVPGEKKMVYSHIDRIIVGGICPSDKTISLEDGCDTMKELGTSFFLERRELGVINVGGHGRIAVDGKEYFMDSRDCLYIGKGAKEVLFLSDDKDNPAKYYLNSTPAHYSYPVYKIDIKNAKKVPMGDTEFANRRIINQFIHPEVLSTCQLMMGMTQLDDGSVWNTMPVHTHERRMEVYFYFDLPEDGVVFHFMGEHAETRHLVVKNEEAVISPSWSIHAGCGSKNYSFVWGMAGENQTFTDMDQIKTADIK